MTDEVTPIVSRKQEHIRINLEEDVESGLTTGFEHVHLPHEALPELNLEEIDLSTSFMNKQLRVPILISSMTGGTDEAHRINRNLARAAQQHGIAMGLGSQRAAIERTDTAPTFQVRSEAPDILLFANLGAVQLNTGYGPEECRQTVEMVGADALVLHLNPLQEALQPGGDTHFRGLLARIKQVCDSLDVPVIVKEVGWGISVETARKLLACGVNAVDVAGAGGTSWSQVERHRAATPQDAHTASLFRAWGIPTAIAVKDIRSAFPDLPLIASGGLRHGLHLAKALALGADMGGFAGPMLKAAVDSSEAVSALLTRISRELRISMFASGCADIPSLKSKPVRMAV